MFNLKNGTKLLVLLIVIIIILSVWFSVKPSGNRVWSDDQKVLSYAEFNDENPNNILMYNIRIYNIRNFSYTSASEYTTHYYNKTVNLNDLNSVYYMVEPFSEWEGAAHTLLSFGFENDDMNDDINMSKQEYLVISVEIRKEKNEHFSALKGLFKQYELMYVIGDERDLINLRANYRNDTVYFYPIKTTKENMKKLFVDMIKRTNKLKNEPEFYNTITSTCTTNIVDHVNKIAPERVPFSFKILAPGYSDKHAYNIGLIDLSVNKNNPSMSFEEAREYFKINQRARKAQFSDNFSEIIRGYNN